MTDSTRLEPLLDLDDDRRAALARVLESAEAALGAVRYGSRLRVGVADVVLNPDSPLASGARATGLDGAPAAVEATLRALPAVFAEAGLPRVLVHASPSSAPELPLLAEELGYDAVEERTVLLLTRPHLLVEGEPGRSTVPLPEALEDQVAALVAEAHGWSRGVERRLHRVLGHRFDDPRHVAVAALGPEGELVGVATGFLAGEVGQVVDAAVRPRHRRRGAGSALVSAVAAELLLRGAATVWSTAEAGGRAERLGASLGLEPAYDAVSYVLGLD
ncbi:MAG TPA: GNAT family N-acetyltransferase [Mycobacteriales bacterium]|nr:GNAT family N-acetyltransferase [Mycobacteriales bacterium]